MAQTIVWPQNKFEQLNAMNQVPPVAHIELADQTISTTGTMHAVQDFGTAGCRQIRVRVRVKSLAAADAKTMVLRVSTTSAMTAPEVVAVQPIAALVLTTDIYDFDLEGWSMTGFQYAQASFAGTTTITYDAILEAV